MQFLLGIEFRLMDFVPHRCAARTTGETFRKIENLHRKKWKMDTSPEAASLDSYPRAEKCFRAVTVHELS